MQYPPWPGRLEPVAQPYGAAWQHLAAFERHRGDRSRHIRVVIGRIEDSRGTFRAIHCRVDRDADFIDQPDAQKAAVGDAAAIDLEPSDAELSVKAFERHGKIELMLAGAEVGDAIPTSS